jgi:hypothetical protein
VPWLGCSWRPLLISSCKKKYRDLYKFRFDERESICPVVEVTTNE